jgi:predicted transcriptional regulator
MMDENRFHEQRLLIARFIKKRRDELNLTQKELADKCQIGLNTVIRLEDGRFWLNSKQLVIIFDALNLAFIEDGNTLTITDKLI